MSLLPVTNCFGGYMDVIVASDQLFWWTHGCHCMQYNIVLVDTLTSLLPVTHRFGGHIDVIVASDTLFWWTH